jgi:hypothetical protein
MISLYHLLFLTTLLLLLLRLSVLCQAQVHDDVKASFYFGGSAPDAYTTDLAKELPSIGLSMSSLCTSQWRYVPPDD